MKKINKSILINIIIILSGFLVSFLIIEIIIRLIPEEFTKIDYSIVRDERIYNLSRGVKFKPNLSRVWTGLGPPTIWHFNNLGFRDRAVQINKSENVFRIVVIGDSIVMGFGVEDFESFPRKMEQILKPQIVNPNMSHFEVINMGIQGYSTPQYLAVLKEEALKIKPNLIIMTIYPSNDLLGVVSFEKDKLYTRLMSFADLIPFPINQYLKEKSKLYLFLLTKYYTFIQKYQSDYKISEADNEYGWRLMENDIKKMKIISEQQNIKLVILIIPNPKDIVNRNIPLPYYQERLVDIVKQLQITYYDSFNDLEKYPKIRELYLDDLDDHFSPKGNEYLATLLSSFLWDNKLVPKQ